MQCSAPPDLSPAALWMRLATSSPLSIPDQLCVAGFDDIEQASWSSYDLTTFAQPVGTIAHEATLWLEDGRNFQTLKTGAGASSGCMPTWCGAAP